MTDDMIPFEKDLYVGMLVNKVEEENEKMKLKEMQDRSNRKRR